MDNQNHAEPQRRGRPRKDAKVPVTLRIRKRVLQRFRYHMGHVIFCEAVERAMLEEIKRLTHQAA